MRILACLFLSLFLYSCQTKEDRKARVLALREMNDLATVEYSVTKIIRASDDQTWYKVGDRKILMSCKATLRAGIDMTKLDASAIDINGDEVHVTLPRAKLLSINLRPEDVKVEYQEVGLLRSDFSAAERDDLMARGEAQIKAGVPELGILNTAESNAALFTGNFLRQLGYKKVKVDFADGPSVPALK